MRLLTEQEKSEVIQVIKEAEKQTSCEFVVSEIERCDDYNSARFAWGIIFALLSCLVLLLTKINLVPVDWTWSVGSRSSAPIITSVYPVVDWVLFQAVGFLLGFFLISRISFLKRLLIPRAKMQNEVHYRAQAEFYEQGLYKTREENGILIMLSVFERMVIVLADKGVNTKVSQDYWETMKNKIVKGIKQKKGGAAVCEAIKSITEDLKQHFPHKADDKNELPDTIETK